MADQNQHETRTESRPAALNLSARVRGFDQDGLLPPEIHTAIPPGLKSPGICVEFHGDAGLAPAPSRPRPPPLPLHPQSAPPDVPSFPSPMRHHRRTPSVHREIKETLDARSAQNDDEDGRTLIQINQYTIGEEIGRGSYGSVHLATDQYGTEYAVKAFSKTRLRKQAQSSILRRGPGNLARPSRAEFGAPDAPVVGYTDQRANEAKDALYFIRKEVAIMKKLNHPNLVGLIEVLDDPEDDTLYMVMEMCKKGVVMKVGLGQTAEPYPEEQCRVWFRDLILGIEYLHSQGILHRDIKPDNLLLTDDDVLKIVDFGVSEMFERSGEMRTSKTAGSPAFLPPELCVVGHGDVSGKAADIWSMGVSLYCLRYGRVPFEGNILEVYDAIKTQDLKLPDDENPDFVDLMSKIMEKDPNKRIAMEDLREHPWVTRGGTDPLLSAEENCTDLVEPNPLEVNHAFTRKMTNLICVMKAISKFKSLLGRRGASARAAEEAARSSTSPPPEPDDAAAAASAAANAESTAECAARVVLERQKFLASRNQAALAQLLSAAGSPASDLAIPLPPPSPRPAVLLGIGTGGIDDFSTAPDELPPANVVSDSPTAVDFNVYSMAYEAELERIKRTSSRRAVGRGDRGGRSENGGSGGEEVRGRGEATDT
ncbi:hypothetical protein VTJ83DRAFT_2560 [Remersonia thermophila]|uniref:Protein kinase domain-containing protein n=1 Tax=Remersonia thermophila TaxID=72144 RepID=A0ABR4DJ25_9PEZI